ncbi:MAG: hypothetical protein U1E56_11745 [Bauldia sp.]
MTWIGDRIRGAAAAALFCLAGGQQALCAGAFDAAGPSFLGTWSGALTQPGRPGTYPVVITITAQTATTTYPDGSCIGTLRRIGASGEYAFYSEVIARGKYDPVAAPEGCIDGSITLARAADHIVFHWFGFHGEPITATGVLTPGVAVPAAATPAPSVARTAQPAPSPQPVTATTTPAIANPTTTSTGVAPPAGTNGPAIVAVETPATASATTDQRKRPPFMDPVTTDDN